MDSLSNKDKVALAKQFNIIVRAINEYQVNNWAMRDEQEFKELIKKEKEILLFVEQLLDRSTNVLFDEPSSLVVDVENFSEDVKMQLKYSKLKQASNLATRTTLLASSIFGYLPDTKKRTSLSEIEYYS